jgi:hypothetical protein
MVMKTIKSLKSLLIVSLVFVMAMGNNIVYASSASSVSQYDKYKNTNAIYIANETDKEYDLHSNFNSISKKDMPALLASNPISYRVTSKDLLQADSSSVINEVVLANVGIGMSITTTSTKTTSGSITISSSLSESVKSPIFESFNLSASGSLTATVSKSTTFSFPSSFESLGYNTCTWYLGIGKDKYRVNLAEYELKGVVDPSGTIGIVFKWVATGNTLSTVVEVPKKTVYAIGHRVY